MAWLTCSNPCISSDHWTVVEDFKVPSTQYYQSSGVWYYYVKNRRTLTREHRSLTFAAAVALADALTTYDPRGGTGIAGSTYRSAKVFHVSGEEYGVNVTEQIHEALEGPYVSQSAQ